MIDSDVYIFSSSNLSGKIEVPYSTFDKAKHGDEAAFGHIYDLFYKKIYRFIYFRVSHKETAEDLAEEVFLKAFGRIGSVRNHEALEGWLYQIARNTVIDYYRAKKTTVALDDIENTLQYESAIIDILNLSQDQQLLMDAVKELGAEQQIVIKLKFLEELDNATIAELLDKTEGAVRVIQHRAIAKLQELIKTKLNKD